MGDARSIQQPIPKESHRREAAKSNFDLAIRGLTLNDVSESTAIISTHHAFTGTPSSPLVPPIYHASTYVLDKTEDLKQSVADGGSCYSRLSNLTTESLESTINTLERGAGTLSFASGMAAITSVMMTFLKSGDHVILQIPCYPGTITAVKHLQDNFGVELTKVQASDFEDLGQFIKSNTKLIWIETPSNPAMDIVDVRKISQSARKKNILVATDGTFASPYAQKLIELGVDFSIHSCTKYMGGHSDLIAGCVTARTNKQWRMLKHVQGMLGNMLSPHDASLLLRSLKTLPLRMERISSNALKVASFLESHPKVERVSFPGLPSHPQYQVAAGQMKCWGGMIMIIVKGGGPAGKVLAESTKLIRLAVSLGGVESILEHPYSMTHGPHFLDDQEMEESGVLPGLLRISIGLEDPGDLIQDLTQALKKIKI